MSKRKPKFSPLMGTAMRDADEAAEYHTFLDSKRVIQQAAGFTDARDIQLNPLLFDWQRDLVHWALRVGRADLWCDCGLGKSFMSLEWARVVNERTNKNVLILTPLAVAAQMKREGEKFGIGVTVCKSQADVRRGLNVANYERLEKLDPAQFGAIVCDEVSILKSYEGSTRKQITEFAAKIPYRLGASATPAPNDFMELGTQSEFVGSLTRTEMLATFFVHDGGETSKWRLKKHAEDEFWKWISTWAVYIRKPSDLGYSDDGFNLPPLQVHQHVVESQALPGDLFPVEAKTLSERRQAKKDSIDARIETVASLVNASTEPWIVWCNLNPESKALTKAIPTAVEVTGSMSLDAKEEALEAFASGKVRDIVSKCSIAGFGLNWQHCRNQSHFLSDSFEQYYQGVRRSWRFGQKLPVNIHIVSSSAEGAVVKNIERKERDAARMAERISEHMKDLTNAEVRGVRQGGAAVTADEERGDRWRAVLGDCVTALSREPDESVHYSVFSPPFASLYTYSDALADMGNCKTHAEFFDHMRFLVPQIFRLLKPGRLVSFHCMNLPKSKERDGVIGLTDFRGQLIRLFEEFGFIFHSEVCIWKDPVTAMQRTKAIGLLYKQLRKDSALSRQGIPDYLVTMRKPGVNTAPITKTHESYPVGEWQNTASPAYNDISEDSVELARVGDDVERFAGPLWMDINPSDTLQKESAREHNDERHIAPLQLEVIRRAIRLWSNPNDIVMSPFMGIGSEGYVALQLDRQFLGVELKRSYWEQAVANLKAAHLVQSAGLLTDEVMVRYE